MAPDTASTAKTTPVPQRTYASRPSMEMPTGDHGLQPPAGSSQRYAFQTVEPSLLSRPYSQMVPPSVMGTSSKLP